MFAWNTRVACHDRDVVYSQVALFVETPVRNVRSSVLVEPLQRCACTTKVDVALPLHRRIYVYTPSPLYIYIFTRSHPQIYLSTSPHPHICTSISHLYIHTVAPSHLSCLSFFLRIFSLVSVHLHLRTLTSTDLPLHLHTSTDLYRTCTSHCHSFTSTLSFSLSIHLFDSAGQLHVSLSGQPSSSFHT